MPERPLPQGAAGHGWERLIDAMIADPFVTQADMGARFGLSTRAVAAIWASDEFQRAYAARVEAVVDPTIRTIRLSVEERFRGVAMRTLELAAERLEADPSDQFILRALELTTRALGYGSKEPAPASVTNVTNHLTVLGENLVGLLARKRAQADATPTLEHINGEAISESIEVI